MSGQLCWLSLSESDEKLSLYLRLESHHPWKLYTAFPKLQVPDYPVPGGTKGWATYQKLLQAGWTLIPTAKAKEVSIVNLHFSLKN